MVTPRSTTAGPAVSTVSALIRSLPSRTQMLLRTPLSAGTRLYSTFCQALSAAVERVTMRSLKAKLIPATSSAARNSGAST